MTDATDVSASSLYHRKCRAPCVRPPLPLAVQPRPAASLAAPQMPRHRATPVRHTRQGWGRHPASHDSRASGTHRRTSTQVHTVLTTHWCMHTCAHTHSFGRQPHAGAGVALNTIGTSKSPGTKKACRKHRQHSGSGGRGRLWQGEEERWTARGARTCPCRARLAQQGLACAPTGMRAPLGSSGPCALWRCCPGAGPVPPAAAASARAPRAARPATCHGRGVRARGGIRRIGADGTAHCSLRIAHYSLHVVHCSFCSLGQRIDGG